MLLSCRRGSFLGMHSCTHFQDAGVRCPGQYMKMKYVHPCVYELHVLAEQADAWSVSLHELAQDSSQILSAIQACFALMGTHVLPSRVMSTPRSSNYHTLISSVTLYSGFPYRSHSSKLELCKQTEKIKLNLEVVFDTSVTFLLVVVIYKWCYHYVFLLVQILMSVNATLTTAM